jgi:nucleotide-binding universal stress UspA family protein
VLAICKPSRDLDTSGKQGDHIPHLSRILFCADFSKNSKRALDYAISLTAEYDAELTLLHVLEDLPSSAETKEAIATATEQLDKMIPRDVRKTRKIKTTVRIGKPYQQIIQLALKARTDLVTMAVRGRGALDLAVFGSTTYRVMQLGPCPVLAVHSWSVRPRSSGCVQGRGSGRCGRVRNPNRKFQPRKMALDIMSRGLFCNAEYQENPFAG